MERVNVNSLILNDDDLNCNTVTLSDLKLSDTNFNSEIFNKFELVVYQGKKGTKILKSNYFKKGKIV